MKRTITVLLALLAPLTVFADAEKSVKPAGTKVRLKTNHGDIVLSLDKEKAPITVATSEGFFICAGDRLTATGTSSFQWAASSMALRITHSPKGTMIPVSSAQEMNTPGETRP
jgi:hypothetical protein